MEFLRLLLRRRFARAQVATSRNVGCFLRLVCLPPVGVLKATTFIRIISFIVPKKSHGEWSIKLLVIIYLFISYEG